MNNIPKSESGSINYYTSMVVDDLEESIMRIPNNTNLILNIISNLESHGYDIIALKFAKAIIKLVNFES